MCDAIPIILATPTSRQTRGRDPRWANKGSVWVLLLVCTCVCKRATVTWSIDGVHLRFVGWQVKSKGRLKGSPHPRPPRPCRKGALIYSKSKDIGVSCRKKKNKVRKEVNLVVPQPHVRARTSTTPPAPRPFRRTRIASAEINQISAAKHMTGGNKRGERRREQNKEDLWRLSGRHESNTPTRQGPRRSPCVNMPRTLRRRSIPTRGAQECGGAAPPLVWRASRYVIASI